jgi:phosphatidylserine/phosphatidylglycerophosphate/cardiolipin synthase-like enzyme
MIDRFVHSGHIGHNKFCVYVDPAGVAQAVLLGSTNWTITGLCTQSNNSLIAESRDLAAAYLAEWNLLKKDTAEDDSKQGDDLRGANAQPGARDVGVDKGSATVWFSPNTSHQRKSPHAVDEQTPPDMAEVFALMEQAEQAILFLEFQPGKPSVVGKAAEIANEKPELFIRGAVTDPNAVGEFNITLTHRTGEDPVEVVAASAITDQFSYWQQELLKAGPMAHAIIHDKIVVIDPMTPNCVVVTGSHNHGYQASYNNDENLLIVRGHQALAQAYAVHIMDVYDHYRFRYIIQKYGTGTFSGLDPTDGWQDKYFKPDSPISKEMEMWFSASVGNG